MISGSAISWPTRLRGLSDAYGSWKTICICRRSGRSARRLSVEMSRPSKMTWPPVSSWSRTRQRPSVDLPQPDSPTSPSVSPGRTSKETASTACTWATSRRITPPPLTGKCFVTARASSSGSPLTTRAPGGSSRRGERASRTRAGSSGRGVPARRAPPAPAARRRPGRRAGSAARTSSRAAARAATGAGPGWRSAGAACGRSMRGIEPSRPHV